MRKTDVMCSPDLKPTYSIWQRTWRILLPSTLSCQVEIDARSSKPRDVPIFAGRSANARISGTHEPVARRNANALDPDRLRTVRTRSVASAQQLAHCTV